MESASSSVSNGSKLWQILGFRANVCCVQMAFNKCFRISILKRKKEQFVVSESGDSKQDDAAYDDVSDGKLCL